MRKANEDPSQSTGQRKPAYRKWLLPLVFVHLLAVLAEPLFFFSRSDFQSGPEFYGLRRWLAPYVDWMYLDHGYFFFAPNPGPSHLVALQESSSSLTTPKSLKSDAFIFPDRKEQWPRLLYHRYFMLSEFYNNSFAPSRLVQEDQSDPMFVQRWTTDRLFYETLQRSMAKSLEASLGRLQSLELIRLERPLRSPEEILQEGKRLDDSRSLIVLPEGPEDSAPTTQAGQP